MLNAQRHGHVFYIGLLVEPHKRLVASGGLISIAYEQAVAVIRFKHESLSPDMHATILAYRVREVFGSFHEFFEVFGRSPVRSDLSGPVRMHSDTFGCIRMPLEAFGRFPNNSETIGFFFSLLDIFGCFLTFGGMYFRRYLLGGAVTPSEPSPEN